MSVRVSSKRVPKQKSLNRFGHRYALMFVIASIVIFILRLLIMTSVEKSAYEIADLTRQSTEIKRNIEFLNEKNNVLNSPQLLAEQAEKLGMVESSNFLFLRLSDGEISGKAGSEKSLIGSAKIPNAARVILTN